MLCRADCNSLCFVFGFQICLSQEKLIETIIRLLGKLTCTTSSNQVRARGDSITKFEFEPWESMKS